jgi:diaminohydroxyphosphoribosylaminopyrimidine deaminase/5-amino-6-(5-phosphoribosylamino)uracil reductase
MMDSFSAADQTFMARAIDVARQNLGATGSNPSVGCVLVKDGVVLAEAATSLSGRPHAERNALNIAGEAARGATAYVTLEPCSHHGKTPPCAGGLIEAGIARVVVAVDDPDIRVSGRGYQMLRDAGIAVETGLLRNEAKRGLIGYLNRQVKKRPYVILKLAVSTDGMIGRKGEGQVAITGPEAKQFTYQQRAESDAILVGIGTALADDPELTVRIAGSEDRSPIRIILDEQLRLLLGSKLVQSAGQVPVIVVSSKPDRDRAEALRAAGVEVLELAGLEALLDELGARGISQLFVEGGASVAKSFVDAHLVDRVILLQGQGVIGETGVETPINRQNIPTEFQLIEESLLGTDQCSIYERPI